MAYIIRNTEYITVKCDEEDWHRIFVGGEPATRYRGVIIWDMDYVSDTFAWIQEFYPNITELHVLSSKTCGKFAMVDNPSFEHGENAWCRVKNNEGKLGDWVFVHAFTSAAACGNDCALHCAVLLRANAAFRRAVCGTANDKQNSQPKQNALTDALKNTDLSQFVGTHRIGPYEIVVSEFGQNTRG